VSGGLNRLFATAFVAGATCTALLAGAPAALACNGGTSAVNVYSECLPTGGGSKPTAHHTKTRSSKGSRSGGPTSSSPTSSGPTTAPATKPKPPLSKHTAHALKNAGQDRRVLSALVHGYGPTTLRANEPISAAAAPTALGSAFDLGSGPTALLIILAGTALLMLGGSGLRTWRDRNNS
jgi:hypothetical protein